MNFITTIAAVLPHGNVLFVWRTMKEQRTSLLNEVPLPKSNLGRFLYLSSSPIQSFKLQSVNVMERGSEQSKIDLLQL